MKPELPAEISKIYEDFKLACQNIESDVCPNNICFYSTSGYRPSDTRGAHKAGLAMDLSASDKSGSPVASQLCFFVYARRFFKGRIFISGHMRHLHFDSGFVTKKRSSVEELDGSLSDWDDKQYERMLSYYNARQYKDFIDKLAKYTPVSDSGKSNSLLFILVGLIAGAVAILS